MAEGSSSAQTIRLPRTEPGPFRLLATRFAVASGAIVFIALVAYIGRSGYRDAAGDGVSFLDALYYASVSVTTTGYGDIAPAWRDVDPPVARTKRITLYTLRGNPRLRRVPIRSPARPQFWRTFDHSSAV